jgi:tetratricopeptide (TPR) repeat protein
MTLEWFDAREASKIAVELADEFSPPQVTPLITRGNSLARGKQGDGLQVLLERADREVRGLRLNFYKKAKFANSFKWRLLENGVEKAVADEVTQALVLHLSGNKALPVLGDESGESPSRSRSKNAKHLLEQANRAIDQGHYADAIALYEELTALDPRHAAGFNNLGAALFKIGRVKEAESCFLQAIKLQPDFPDALSNMGTLLQVQGRYADAENFLRRAVKLNPRFVSARINLGLTLAFLGRSPEAKSQYDKALKYEPRNAYALVSTALLAQMDGEFDRAGAMLSRALRVEPKMPRALAAQASMRKMTNSDSAWLQSAQEVASSGIAHLDESELRFAIGKYYDDIGNFKLAFENYQRGNDLLKAIAEPFDSQKYQQFVDIMCRVHPREAVSRGTGGSASKKPVFVVGMPRSGTSLTEQIISSHPSAKGAGELQFWSLAMLEHEALIKAGGLDESARNKLAEGYLKLLDNKFADAKRVVDKAPVNCDYLGVIHSVFPNARIIYMQRNPIDTCLSCYFQKFVLSLNYTMDLSDLADYYKAHRRLMAHWRAVLPPGTILEVPYEELVADQKLWSRRIMDFIDLEWDEQVLEFQDTRRTVATASTWQVRQRIYQHSVGRFRNYQKFLGPLRDLPNLPR